jgi:hypothetical protein
MPVLTDTDFGKCTWCPKPATHRRNELRHMSDGDSIAEIPECDLGDRAAHEAVADTIEPHVAETFEVGAILDHSWGYDQTNVDFFCVVKRNETPTGQVWLTLAPMTKTTTETLSMQGHTVPGEIREGAKTIRRKLKSWDGQERGLGIERSYGWCGLWDGKPVSCSWYA